MTPSLINGEAAKSARISSRSLSSLILGSGPRRFPFNVHLTAHRSRWESVRQLFQVSDSTGRSIASAPRLAFEKILLKN